MRTAHDTRFVSLVVAGLLVISTPWADAGALSRTLFRELAERITARQLTTSAEREAYHRILLELDSRTLRSIEKRFGNQIPRESLEHARQSASTFLDKDAYRLWLRKAYPDVSAKELSGVVGDTRPLTRRVTVNRNQVTLTNTLTHERLHQLSHPRFGASFGKELNEGTTDYFARRVSGDLNLVDAQVGYPAERELADMIVARVGEEPLARAYFQGNFNALAYSLEHDLGPGSFAALQRVLQRGDISAARALLLGK